ncbi:hypothetical protein BDQ17DRAFT_1426823 [Cyathus striatus]|nr:hypothetical protein BDQ17DRAFT_1426823 [Cyathus striatus]
MLEARKRALRDLETLAILLLADANDEDDEITAYLQREPAISPWCTTADLLGISLTLAYIWSLFLDLGPFFLTPEI